MNTTSYLDLDCVELANSALTLLVTQSVGPRILALRLGEGENLFAELPDVALAYPGGGTYQLYGGHRLWHAPEVPHRTYIPDGDPVAIEPIESGLAATQNVEGQTGLQKSLHIRLPDESATVIVDHTLTNRGMWPITCAPWAITQLRAGGVAILPQNDQPADPDGVQPNRSLVLWPYTDLRSEHLTWGNRCLFVRASFRSGAFKVGFPNARGWLAYHWQDTLFVKFASYQAGAEYFDLGGSSQCYCNPRFLELETLGPKAIIEPGETATHREIWRVLGGLELAPSEEDIQIIIDDMQLADFVS